MKTKNDAVKGIYIVPGLLGSRLYNDDGTEVWADLALAGDIISYGIFGERGSVFSQNKHGEGTRSQTDAVQDTFGTTNVYEPLIEGISDMLAQYQLDQSYEVNFFPYHWMEDLQGAVEALEADIAAKGYQKIILIGHSMGGVLSAAYVGSSQKNKAMIEKVILLGAPLWGTYAALQPIETGTTTLFNGQLSSVLQEILNTLILKPFLADYIRNFAKNSPGFYQLLPSEEYIASLPMKYNFSEIADSETYYKILSKSQKINNNILFGNERSQKKFRETVFAEGVVNQLAQVDTVLMGTASGFITPTNVAYRRQLITGKSVYQNIIFTRDGDSTVSGISALLNGQIPYINYEGITHGDLASDEMVLNNIYKLIRGEAVELSTEIPKADMSDLIKVTLEHSDYVNIQISNADKIVIAEYADGIKSGFDGKDFLHLTEDQNGVMVDHIFMPAKGYKVKIGLSSLNKKRSMKPFHLIKEKLGEDGVPIAQEDFTSSIVSVDGTIVELDLIN